MKFGPVSPREAQGATAVHTIRQGSLVLKKGTLIGPDEVKALEAAGIKDIVVARLEPGDVSEDKAAAEIAKAVAGEGVRVDRAFTGRDNLFAEIPGVLVVDERAMLSETPARGQLVRAPRPSMTARRPRDARSAQPETPVLQTIRRRSRFVPSCSRASQYP
jgi:hypothetical protein